MAYQWLDAQTKTRTPARRYHPIKRLVEQWCGRYISMYDVEAAALLHPEIVEGEYPFYNISERFLLPNKERLTGIGEAFKHRFYRLDQTDYWRHEDGRDIVDAVKRDLLVEAVFDYVGERCRDYVEGCRCCEAWNQYDLASAYGATRTS